jgi:hypothetical protein
MVGRCHAWNYLDNLSLESSTCPTHRMVERTYLQSDQYTKVRKLRIHVSLSAILILLTYV